MTQRIITVAAAQLGPIQRAEPRSIAVERMIRLMERQYYISHTTPSQLERARDSGAADRSSPWDSRRLWSLWDMIRQFASGYFHLGMQTQEFRVVFDFLEAAGRDGDLTSTNEKRIEVMDEGSKAGLKRTLSSMAKICGELGLPEAQRIAARASNDLPETRREFNMVVDTVRAGLESRIFLSVPQHLADYYESDGLASDKVKVAFPSAYTEIRDAGTALASGLSTACVFHAMRAAEIGVRVLGTDLRVVLPVPIELAEWQPILYGMKARIEAIENLPRSTPTRDADLLFYSEASAQFRFFKNGWRIRVAHARASYNETQAKEAIDHVRSFFELLASRLSE
jgi:hypothetical protein